jgi:TonB family protein
VIASSGFGSAVAGGGNGRGNDGTGESQVTVGGFQKARLVAQAPAQNLEAPPPADFQTIEILSKPSPVYTEEARQLRIQGDVALSVVFQANGAIKVTGVVRSLGYGLDQAAERAATQIRFKPAKRDGLPTDFPATLRIEFRLADQST